MRLVATLMLALSLAPTVAVAHGEAPKPAHGGILQEAHELWLELVVNASDVTVYVLDQARQPVPSSELSGTATVLAGGRSHKVTLSPGAANSLHGTLPIPATGKVVATVALQVAGKPASARFIGGA